ncbi:MAG: YHS domain-containing protein [Tepidisphaeraceae bacterium]|jgi:YHS domain-containing protein
MRRRTLVLLSVAVGLGLAGLAGFAGFAVADDMAGMNMAPPSPPATQPATQPSAAVDLRNTVCPVSGDKVGDSNIVEVYDGKVYHLCCPDCHKDFEKDPAKYAKAVAADPAKFGVK